MIARDLRYKIGGKSGTEVWMVLAVVAIVLGYVVDDSLPDSTNKAAESAPKPIVREVREESAGDRAARLWVESTKRCHETHKQWRGVNERIYTEQMTACIRGQPTVEQLRQMGK